MAFKRERNGPRSDIEYQLPARAAPRQKSPIDLRCFRHDFTAGRSLAV